MVTHCPKHRGTKLLADGSDFVGMPNAGWCPKCRRFYRWSSGEPVGATKITTELKIGDHLPPVEIIHRGGITMEELYKKAQRKFRVQKLVIAAFLNIRLWLLRLKLFAVKAWSRLKL
jgi:thiol-disulfide isomerase/thioredoxin